MGMSHAMRVIRIATDILKDEQGFSEEEASARVAQTIAALSDTRITKLTPTERDNMRAEIAAGWPVAVVARTMNVSDHTAAKVRDAVKP
jgi:hypothetical protein